MPVTQSPFRRRLVGRIGKLRRHEFKSRGDRDVFLLFVALDVGLDFDLRCVVK